MFSLQMNPAPPHEFLSGLAFESSISAFMDAFMPNLPFFHLMTWQAKQAEPMLLLAMAAIGARIQGEYAVARTLHQASRQLMLDHVSSDSFHEIYADLEQLSRLRYTYDQTPLWLVQTMHLVMSFGTRSGEWHLMQAALALQSTLANVSPKRHMEKQYS